MNCSMCENIKNIKDDSHFIMELETGYAMLGWHQRFKGYTVFICKEHACELHELDSSYKLKFLEEMSLVSEAVFNAIKPEKLNYELLGNGIAHMHWHIYPRITGDTPQKGPVWWLPKEELFDESTRPDENERTKMKAKIKREILQLQKNI